MTLAQQNLTETSPAVEVLHVRKHFLRAGEKVEVLCDVSMNVKAGSFVALMGPSGSGKSTLLNLIAGLDRPSSGSVRVTGRALEGSTESELASWRSATVGFVFQAYNLFAALNAVQNVEMPLLLRRMPASERRARAETALRLVGLEHRRKHYPSELSGGQAQRVAIARAIVNDPALLVADEPTGDLDRAAAGEILDILSGLSADLGKTILMVTHDPIAAERAGSVLHLEKGALK